MKKYKLTTIICLLIWVACMVPVPEVPHMNGKFTDKWVHFLMFGSMALTILIDYWRTGAPLKWHKPILGAILVPTIMGGLVELAQAYLTNGMRSGDWMDFVADGTGAVIGAIIGTLLVLFLSRKNKDS